MNDKYSTNRAKSKHFTLAQRLSIEPKKVDVNINYPFVLEGETEVHWMTGKVLKAIIKSRAEIKESYHAFGFTGQCYVLYILITNFMQGLEKLYCVSYSTKQMAFHIDTLDCEIKANLGQYLRGIGDAYIILWAGATYEGAKEAITLFENAKIE